MKPLTLLLAEDHAVVRDGLRAFIQTVEDMAVVGEATTGREAVELAARLRPAVIVMDVAHAEAQRMRSHPADPPR